MKHAIRIDWKIPLTLLVVSAIPVAAGIARLVGLAGNPEVSPENARFVVQPLPVILHVISATLFSVLGVLQLSTGLRLRNPRWHRVSGRVVVASGIFVAVSGVWMTVTSPIPPELQGSLLYAVRVLVSAGMLLSIFWAVVAISRRHVAAHRA